jgi:hypothetical protein
MKYALRLERELRPFAEAGCVVSELERKLDESRELLREAQQSLSESKRYKAETEELRVAQAKGLGVEIDGT